MHNPCDDISAAENAPEEEILCILDVPPEKMGRVIGRRGASIMFVKESCNAEILIGGAKGPPDKVFIIGPVKQPRKAEAILRGRMMNLQRETAVASLLSSIIFTIHDNHGFHGYWNWLWTKIVLVLPNCIVNALVAFLLHLLNQYAYKD